MKQELYFVATRLEAHIIYEWEDVTGERYYNTVKRYNEYPISLRNGLTRVEQKDTKMSNYWLKESLFFGGERMPKMW